MDPVISAISTEFLHEKERGRNEEEDVLRFTLSGVNVSIANALRRTVLSDIPTVTLNTEPYDSNQCVIEVNTTRLHNEMLKHRLSCIPIHMTDLDLLPDKYRLVLDMQNDTDNMIIVTSENFRIQNKETGNFLVDHEMRSIFPPNPITNMFIDFARIRPKIGDSIPGEHIKLTAEFSVHTAKDNSMFNVVSKCSYGNTVDQRAAEGVWTAQEVKLSEDGETEEEIEFQKRNFYLLDAFRYFKPDSFDFVIQTLGIFENKDILKKACIILVAKFEKLFNDLDKDDVSILVSETTIDHCYDVVLDNEDYTMGKVLEYILYEKYYVEDKSLSFCGFKKFHPHNPDSTLRLAFQEPAGKSKVSEYVKYACLQAVDVFKKMYKLF
uniref:DNA-directed RNA polymerase RpoA/D/Rpb3-type domain-containing protein n=1 Tax=viral metagenome TaxID=1070528 RepID=A0A6C0I5K1_9ZZZZ